MTCEPRWSNLGEEAHNDNSPSSEKSSISPWNQSWDTICACVCHFGRWVYLIRAWDHLGPQLDSLKLTLRTKKSSPVGQSLPDDGSVLFWGSWIWDSLEKAFAIKHILPLAEKGGMGGEVLLLWLSPHHVHTRDTQNTHTQRRRHSEEHNKAHENLSSHTLHRGRNHVPWHVERCRIFIILFLCQLNAEVGEEGRLRRKGWCVGAGDLVTEIQTFSWQVFLDGGGRAKLQTFSGLESFSSPSGPKTHQMTTLYGSEVISPSVHTWERAFSFPSLSVLELMVFWIMKESSRIRNQDRSRSAG